MENKPSVNFLVHIKNLGRYCERVNSLLPVAERLSAYDTALYFHLVCKWNQAYFPEYLDIHRQFLMQASGIGNHNTYVKCLRNLEKLGLIVYIPSNNKHYASQAKLHYLSNEWAESEVATLLKSEQGSEQGTEQGSEQSSEQGSAPLYKQIETRKQIQTENERNGNFSPKFEVFVSTERNLSKEEENVLVEKVVKWCNHVRVNALGMSKLLQTSKEQALHQTAAFFLYDYFSPQATDFQTTLTLINEQFSLYSKFLKSKPNDTFLREVFTPQGITAKNVFQQFEQGVENLQKEEAQKQQLILPEKWDKGFYQELQKNKDKGIVALYEQKLKEEKGLEVYYNSKIKEYAVKKSS